MEESKRCACCSGDAREVLLGGRVGAVEIVEPHMTRATFLKTICAGVLGLSTLSGTKAFAQAKNDANLRMVSGAAIDHLIVDFNVREIRFSATVTKDVTKPAVAEWGKRAIGWIGVKGGIWQDHFIFTTDVSRKEIDKGIQDLGIKFRRQISRTKKEEHTGLKPTTTVNDYLDGDPMTATIRFQKGGDIVESALEDFIQEKITVENQDVIKPYTPHFVYHGTAEVDQYDSGCIVCPSDCPGGIITDNTFPLLTMVNLYRVDWDRMPPLDSRVEVALKSIYSPTRLDSIKG